MSTKRQIPASSSSSKRFKSDDSLSNLRLLTGNAHPELAHRISEELGIPLTSAKIDQFSNTEIRVLVDDEPESNLRNRDIIILQSGGSRGNSSVNDFLMETYLMIDAAQRSSCRSVTVVMPCFPYARQDKKDKPRCPISARVVANQLEKIGATRLMTVDLHSAQITGFFNIPVDNLYAVKILAEFIKSNYFTTNDINDFVLVSPDAGGIKRMYHLAELLGTKTVIMHKQRSYEDKNLVQKTILIGDHDCVRNKFCLIVDDMCDTGGTICKAAETLIEHGAREVKVVITHGVLSGPAIERLYYQSSLTEVITTNTLPLDDQINKLRNVQSKHPFLGERLKISQVDIAPLLASAIRELFTPGGSISDLFK